MSIYVMNLTELSDRSLKMAMNDVPENSVILFEDIDCMKAGNRRPDSKEWMERQPSAILTEKSEPAAAFAVTLSGLLNVLDGFHAPENVIYVMTTNKVEALDPALLRPGRIDYRLFMGEASESQRIELYLRFFPDAVEAGAKEFAQAHCTETMAEFQGLLLALEQGGEVLESASAGLD
jgi:chaperone BCS1